MKAKLLILLAVVLLPVFAFAGDYIIGEGDVVSVHVWGESELNVTTKVRPDGKISIPGIGDVVATKHTAEDLSAILKERLSVLLKSPIVTVSLVESVNSKVFVVGGGVESTVYDLQQRTTLLQLLASLGSLELADLHKSYLYRGGKIVMTDFYDLFTNGDFGKDAELQSGDTVYVPVKYDQNVYVVGAVGAPKPIFWREGLTVLDAILMAGNFNKFADENKTQVVRKKDGKQEIINIRGGDLINKGDMTQNVELSPGDYVIVKESFF